MTWLRIIIVKNKKRYFDSKIVQTFCENFFSRIWEKTFEIYVRLKAVNFQNLGDKKNNLFERWKVGKFLKQNYLLAYSCRFLRSNTTGQLNYRKLHCKYLNARSECNDIVISVYSHYSLDPNAKSSDTKCVTLSIRVFCIRIERIMTVYGNYDVIAFRSCIQIFTV